MSRPPFSPFFGAPMQPGVPLGVPASGPGMIRPPMQQNMQANMVNAGMQPGMPMPGGPLNFSSAPSAMIAPAGVQPGVPGPGPMFMDPGMQQGMMGPGMMAMSPAAQYRAKSVEPQKNPFKTKKMMSKSPEQISSALHTASRLLACLAEGQEVEKVAGMFGAANSAANTQPATAGYQGNQLVTTPVQMPTMVNQQPQVAMAPGAQQGMIQVGAASLPPQGSATIGSWMQPQQQAPQAVAPAALPAQSQANWMQPQQQAAQTTVNWMQPQTQNASASAAWGSQSLAPDQTGVVAPAWNQPNGAAGGTQRSPNPTVTYQRANASGF